MLSVGVIRVCESGSGGNDTGGGYFALNGIHPPAILNLQCGSDGKKILSVIGGMKSNCTLGNWN